MTALRFEIKYWPEPSIVCFVVHPFVEGEGRGGFYLSSEHTSRFPSLKNDVLPNGHFTAGHRKQGSGSSTRAHAGPFQLLYSKHSILADNVSNLQLK